MTPQELRGAIQEAKRKVAVTGNRIRACREALLEAEKADREARKELERLYDSQLKGALAKAPKEGE